MQHGPVLLSLADLSAKITDLTRPRREGHSVDEAATFCILPLFANTRSLYAAKIRYLRRIRSLLTALYSARLPAFFPHNAFLC